MSPPSMRTTRPHIIRPSFYTGGVKLPAHSRHFAFLLLLFARSLPHLTVHSLSLSLSPSPPSSLSLSHPPTTHSLHPPSFPPFPPFRPHDTNVPHINDLFFDIKNKQTKNTIQGALRGCVCCTQIVLCIFTLSTQSITFLYFPLLPFLSLSIYLSLYLSFFIFFPPSL